MKKYLKSNTFDGKSRKIRASPRDKDRQRITQALAAAYQFIGDFDPAAAARLGKAIGIAQDAERRYQSDIRWNTEIEENTPINRAAA